MGDYNAAKAGMISWSKTLSRELAPSITVNCVLPASFETPLTRLHASEYAKEYGNSIEEVFATYARENLAIHRFGNPTELSGLVAFLASARASFITGVSYNVDGGYTKFAF
jgi:3-oxoacyl-[acyl-carrier protein] reductase